MFNDIEQPDVDVGKPNMVFLMFNDIEQHELKKMPIDRSSRAFNRWEERSRIVRAPWCPINYSSLMRIG